MKSLNPSPENCRRRNGVIGLGLIPGDGPATINITVSHGLSRYEVVVPSNSSFGYLKSVICQHIGLKPEMYKLVYGGIGKEDDEGLQAAGVINNSEVLLVEVREHEEKIPEEVPETCVISKGEADVAEVRKEVDKLAQQVSALQGVVDSGNKVDGKEIIYLTEMLMRQLLKLDSIEAEGEGKVQRKIEVRRVQRIVENLDILKSRNSTSSSNMHKNVSVATQWRPFDPGCQSEHTSSPVPSSSPSPMPSSSPSHVPYFTHSTMPPSTFSAVPYCVPSPMPNFAPPPLPYNTSPIPYYTPFPMPYYDHSSMPYFTPSMLPSSVPSPASYYDSVPSPVPYYAPARMPSTAPFTTPSSSKATQNWERFD